VWETGTPLLVITVKPFAAAKAEIERSLATKVKESDPDQFELGVYLTFAEDKAKGRSPAEINVEPFFNVPFVGKDLII
jgi:hypothetical protein